MIDNQIEQISDRLELSLPKGKKQYSLHNFEIYGFPPFLIRRISMELQQKIKQTLEFPQTQWADMQAKPVQRDWQKFLRTVSGEITLPASAAGEIIKEAVSDILKILVQPRKYVPEIIFDGKSSLSKPKLDSRGKRLVVYPHFARALNRYVDGKERPTLKVEECRKIISQLDEKITANYTPLQWAQMLDPLFEMVNGPVDTELFRLFFKDRGMKRTAQKFAIMETEISRSAFIDALFSADLLHDEDDQSKNNDDKSSANESEKGFSNSSEDDDSNHRKASSRSEEGTSSELPPQINETEMYADNKDESQPPEFTVEDMEADADESEAEQDEIQPEADFEIEAEQHGEMKKKEPSSLNEIFISEEQEQTTPLKETTARGEANETGNTGEEQEALIWQQYMESEGDEDGNAAGGRPQKLGEEKLQHRVEKLEALFSDKKNYFINQLFGGSERAYNQALKEIAKKDSWKEASGLINQQIFEDSNVNIYSKAAVDFTDRLQNYFAKIKK